MVLDATILVRTQGAGIGETDDNGGAQGATRKESSCASVPGQ